MFSKFMIPIAVLETLKSMIAGSIFDIFDINQRHLGDRYFSQRSTKRHMFLDPVLWKSAGQYY